MADAVQSDRGVEPAPIFDRRQTPPGVMPRHLQQWVLVGTAVVMVGILSLAGPPVKPRTTVSASPATTAVDPNQQRIEEYQRRVQEQAQRLAAEQAQLQLAKQVAATNVAEPVARSATRSAADTRQASAGVSPERAPHEEPARIADNVAFSRPAPTSTADSSSGVGAPALPLEAAAIVSPPVPPKAPPAPTRAVGAPLRASSTASDLPRFRLSEGSLIETVLTNRLDGTFNGPVNCLVSVPVYAPDSQHLLIPAGARVLGEAKAVNTFGQSRVAVAFHRLIQPNGARIDLDQFQGLNQAGDGGLRDQVDRHYAQIFGVSLALGAIAGFAQAQSAIGFEATGLDAYRQGIAANVSQSSARILDRFLNLLPTVTIREGHRVKVYLSNDLELPLYRDSLMPTGGRP